MFDHLVFEHANVFTALLFVEKQIPAPTNKIAIRKVTEAYSAKDIAEVPVSNVIQSFWKDSEGCIFETRLTGVEGKFVQRLIRVFQSLNPSHEHHLDVRLTTVPNTPRSKSKTESSTLTIKKGKTIFLS